MILIVAEKPSVMKNIIEASLEPGKVRFEKGCAIGKNFIYTHCIGHLLTLMYPGEVDPKYIKWDIRNLPFYFDQIPLKVSESVKEQYYIVEKLLLRPDITEVINACDSDREGDLIFRNLYHYSKCHCKTISRMWLESQTKEGIAESFNNRLAEKEYNNVYFAGKSRSYADYIIGLNSTRAMTAKFGGKDNVLTIGRVQTPTLRIIVDIEKEINAFKPQKYYKLQAIGFVNGAPITGNYVNDKLANNRFLEINDAKKKIEQIGIGDAIVSEAETTKRNEKPKMLYSLSDLQVDMDKRYSMTPIQVLDTVQALYETHKMVTYPRTDETHISKKLADSAISIVSHLCVNDSIRKEILENHYKVNPIMIAKKDIGAHEALTPTMMKITNEQMQKLNPMELKVYMAIVERFLASFMPDAIIEKQKIVFTRNDGNFNAELEICTDLGHRRAYQFNKKEKDNDKAFISAKKGDIVNITELKLVDGETTPPARFTEGSLVKMMKNPSKYVTDKSDKDVLKKVEGIGTEATRAGIIEELKKRNLIEVDKKKYIHPTDKGTNLIDTIPSEKIKSVSLTADFERKLDLVSKGEYDYKEFLKEIYQLELDFVNELRGIDPRQLIYKQNSICTCPNCGGYIIENEQFYSCVNRQCKVAIFKTARGAKCISKGQAINMLTVGDSKTKVLCHSAKTNKDFEAVMTYQYCPNDQYPNHIDFDFDKEADSEVEKKAICKCPSCGNAIIETPSAFSCSNKECNVSIFKQVRGCKKMTKKAAIELLTKGETSTRLKCVTKNNQEMDVYLKYEYIKDDQYPNHIDYIFDKKEDKSADNKKE